MPRNNKRAGTAGDRQKGKNKKRRKSWHRGKGEAFRWIRTTTRRSA